jgi:phytoene desaturase
MTFLELDPMYELVFKDFSLFPTPNPQKMKDQIEKLFPGESKGVDKFLARERVRFEKMYPCLQKDYSSLSSLIRPDLLKALPHLSLGRSVFQVLGDYFDPERLRIAFTFQSKYLGMSPWTCPGAFGILPYIEYAHGVFHVMGGLTRISAGMAKVVEEEGAEIRLNTKVRRLIVENGRARGVELENGDKVPCDEVVINADFAHAMATLVDPQHLRKYRKENLLKRPFSCSTFMLYLGLDKLYSMPHHTVVFAEDYRRNLQEVAEGKLSDDFSFYVRNASINDPQIAPKGHSAVYVLVPAPNNYSRVDWAKEEKRMRDLTLDKIEARTGMKDIRQHIKAEKVITPWHWEHERSVFNGATFNLAHTLGQMLYFRPRNAFEELGNCFLVGGGTHPGSGLPTIYESGRISANLISTKHKVPFTPPQPLRPKQG